MPDVLAKDLIANLFVTIPTAGVAGYFIKKWVDGITTRQDILDKTINDLRNHIVGIPVHCAAMEAHAQRMDYLETTAKGNDERRDTLMKIMGDVIDKKAEIIAVDFIRDAVREIKVEIDRLKNFIMNRGEGE